MHSEVVGTRVGARREASAWGTVARWWRARAEERRRRLVSDALLRFEERRWASGSGVHRPSRLEPPWPPW